MRLGCSPILVQPRGKLPRRFGLENTSIHTSDFFAMLVALRWRRPDRWNLLVLDRSSLFPLLRACAEGDPTRLLRFSCAHLMTRLRAVKRELICSWTGRDKPPLWRQDQLAHPEWWTIAEPLPGGGVRDLCHIAHCDYGLVGIDISSHQGPDTHTIPVLVEGNERQDAGCAQAPSCSLPEDVWWHSGAWRSNYHTKGARLYSAGAQIHSGQTEAGSAEEVAPPHSAGQM